MLFTAGLGLVASPLEVPLCVFKAGTGLPCPACGMGHACREALHFHFAQSIARHPLGVPGMLGLGLVYASLSLDLLTGRRRTWDALRHPWPWWVVMPVLGLIFGVWIWRLCLL